jgi:hypothetical protein
LIFLEWTENEIQAFTEALDKFNDNWKQIAEYVHRSEQSCRAFYQKYRKQNGLIDDEHVKIYFNKKKRKKFIIFLFNRISMKIMQVYQVQKIHHVD